MSLRDFASGLIGNRDDDEKDDGLEPGYVDCPNAGDPQFDVDYGIGHGHICALCLGTGIADAEASIDYQHPDALPAVDTDEDAGLSAVRKLKGEA